MKTFKFIFSFAAAVFFVGCQTYDPTVDPPASGIGFAKLTDAVQVDAANPVYNLQVTATTVSNVDRTLNFTVNADDTDDQVLENQYTYTGTITIPAGSLIGTAPITFNVDNVSYTPYNLAFDLEIPDTSYGYNIDNKLSTTINFKKICDQSSVSLDLVFDEYASETFWRLVNLANPTVDIASTEAGDYADGDVSASASFCLAPGNYRLVLRDSYGDGFCCDFGDGSYSISVNGTQVNSGSGSFASTKNVNFQVQ